MFLSIPRIKVTFYPFRYCQTLPNVEIESRRISLVPDHMHVNSGSTITCVSSESKESVWFVNLPRNLVKPHRNQARTRQAQICHFYRYQGHPVEYFPTSTFRSELTRDQPGTLHISLHGVLALSAKESEVFLQDQLVQLL